MRVIYKNTTIDPPGTIAHAREMGAEVITPKKNFFELMEQNGIPSRYYRFCCRVLKEYRFDKSMDKIVIGVRRSESVRRSKSYMEPTECVGTKASPLEAIYPILDWDDDDVREFLEDRRVKCAPAYYDEQGKFHVERRLGCMCCPLKSKKNRLEDFKAHPYMVKSYCRSAQRYLDTHPNVAANKRFANAYEWFVCNMFYDSYTKFAEQKNEVLFDNFDCKKIIEEYFSVRFD